MEFSWNDIYQDFLNCKTRKCSEREFQNCIFSVFRYYLRWQNSIVAEESIPIGSVNTIRPDFVLYKDEKPQVVIESKEPNHIQTERNKEQLFSYMRQKKVDFGLYIGEVIQLYYDEPADAESPLLMFTLDYNKENQYGFAFVNLFNFVDFDKNRLTDYCTNRIQEIEKKKQMEQDIQQLISDDGVKLCKSLLESHFSSKGYTEADVEMLLGDIVITLRRRCQTPQQSKPAYTTSPTPIVDNNELKFNKKNQMFSINGKGVFTKRECAFELVKLYIEDSPSAYNTIVSIFNGQLPYKRKPKKFVLSKEEVDNWKKTSNDKNKDNRWREKSPLVSSDGITFYVTTQVGDNCPIDFKDIVSLSEKLGYKIEPIS